MEGQAINPGFDDAVHDAQRTFRALLDALSRPGQVYTVAAPSAGDEPVSSAAKAVLLSLADYDTPVWLAEGLAGSNLKEYLAFHCGCPFVDEPKGAGFALMRGVTEIPDLSRFALGSPEYPDRSATLIIDLAGFEPGECVARLTGPGIKSRHEINIAGLNDQFWQLAKRNAELYPLGVDFIFCAGNQVCALPRSTQIQIETVTE